MNERGSTRRRGFWPLALLWLPVGVVTTTAFRFMPERTPSEMTGMWLPMVLMAAPSLTGNARSIAKIRRGGQKRPR